jgi:hypothetical protein
VSKEIYDLLEELNKEWKKAKYYQKMLFHDIGWFSGKLDYYNVK